MMKPTLVRLRASASESVHVTIIRNYDPVVRDKKLVTFKSEPYEIDAALEVVNATTDLIGV